MDYQTFKNGVLGQVIGDGECVALIVNNSQAYTEYLFPSIPWPDIFAPVEGARQLIGDANGQYFTTIPNDHNDPNQTPLQGDVMVFDATPQDGYANTFENPYGHTGICEDADSNGYTLLQQNSPTSGAAVNLTHYAWHYRPCLGWLRPIDQTPVAPAPEVPNEPTQSTPTPTPVTDPVSDTPVEPASPDTPVVQPDTPLAPTETDPPTEAPVAPTNPTPTSPDPSKTNTPTSISAEPGPETPLTLWERILAFILNFFGIK